MSTQVPFSEVVSHFVDSHHGIYSAQLFAQYLDEVYKLGNVKGIDAEGWSTLLAGPDNEDYIEVWANELDNVEITDSDGKTWLVYENEGIYLYPKDVDIDWSDWEQ